MEEKKKWIVGALYELCRAAKAAVETAKEMKSETETETGTGTGKKSTETETESDPVGENKGKPECKQGEQKSCRKGKEKGERKEVEKMEERKEESKRHTPKLFLVAVDQLKELFKVVHLLIFFYSLSLSP